LLIDFSSLSAVIALNALEENKRVYEKIEAMTNHTTRSGLAEQKLQLLPSSNIGWSRCTVFL
jgi:hypothetical protein